MPSVAIVGASRDRRKFGNKAVRAYLARGWAVHPVHPDGGTIEGQPAVPALTALPGAVDRVAFYVPPEVGVALLDDVAALPGEPELWINPGAESDELLARAAALGLAPIQACAIIDVGESPGRYGA